MKRILNIGFVLVLVLLTLSPISKAQITPPISSICYVYLTANDLGIDLGAPVPAWAELIWQNNVSGLGGWSVYRVRTNKCPPPAPCPDCGAAAGGGTAGIPGSPASPISLSTGNTTVTQPDVSVPGLGGGLSLIRIWSSVWPSSLATYSIGLFGPNWRSTYEERIFVGSDYYIKYARSDGSFWSFGIGGGGWMPAAPANVSATLVQGTGAWILTFQSGEKRQFSLVTGVLTAIIDRNGNTTQLTYDGSGRLATVTSPASQHLYFNYGSGSSFLVTSVTSDFGVTFSYGYDAQGRLIQVTKPDLTTLNYAYNLQSQMTSVTDNSGKVLESHTYDSTGRGLTSSQANGVNAFTVTYPQ